METQLAVVCQNKFKLLVSVLSDTNTKIKIEEVKTVFLLNAVGFIRQQYNAT